MGKHVYGLKAKGPNDTRVSLSWDIVLSFEHEARKWAFEQVREEGRTLVDAPNTRDLYLITPMTLASASEQDPSTKRPRLDDGNPAWQAASGAGLQSQWNKGRGSGKGGKGTGKAKGSKGDTGSLRSRDGWGNFLCFAYNNPDEECQGSCNMKHLCRICLERHPMHKCKLWCTNKERWYQSKGKSKGKH